MTVAQDTDQLLDLAAEDVAARGALLERHRDRLRRMITVRIDPRLASRVDPSDVVQDVLVQANRRRLDEYLEATPHSVLPLAPPFRRRPAVDLYRHHIRSARRSVGQEEIGGLPDRSTDELAGKLADRGAGPSEMARRLEGRERVHSALRMLASDDFEILALRFLEELTDSRGRGRRWCDRGCSETACGLGADRIVGNAGDEILIAGYTTWDGSLDALPAIMAEWTSSRTYNQRIANISGGTIAGADGSAYGSRNNGSYFLRVNGASASVHDDDEADVLTGSSGLNWFFFNVDRENGTTRDKLTDLNASEFASDLDWIDNGFYPASCTLLGCLCVA